MTEYPWVPYEHPGTLIPRIAAPFGPFDSLLDVGGGGGVVGWGVWPCHIEVLDIFPPSTPFAAKFTLGNGLDVVKIFGPKSFDVVQCTETIEHLAKEDGGRLLYLLEQTARKFVLLTTPNGYTVQDPEITPNEPWSNNPYQKHLAGWLPEEFMARGYTILFNGQPPASQVIAYKVPTQNLDEKIDTQ